MRGRVLLGVVLAAAAPLAAAEAEEPFSRPRWIAERAAAGARFSGGVLPADPARARAAREAVVAGPPLARRPRPQKDVRVSFDLLEADGGPAQAETQAEPHVAIDPRREATLLAGYQEARFASGGARALTAALSTDGGRTWRETLLPGLTRATGGGFERASDPWVAFGADGRAYFASLAFDASGRRNGIFVSASEDGGATWRDPVAVHLESANFDDKEAIAVDSRDDSPFRGRVYVGWDTVLPDGRQILRVAHSADGGASFSAPADVDPTGANVGALPLVGPGGVVYVVWTHFASRDQAWIAAARSPDGGVTWSSPVRVADLVLAEVAEMRTGSILPAAAVDGRSGALYVAWQDGRIGAAQILLARSLDGGETWSAPRRVSDGPLDAANFTPALAVAGNGSLLVTYYSLRDDPHRRYLVQLYAAVSYNGRRFLRASRVSRSGWDARFAALAGGFFLGDYQGLAAGRTAFYPVWIATLAASPGDGVPQPDAFTRVFAP
jgi:hypothetical protein